MDVCQLIEKNIDTEGIFRKSGSVMRQKELRVSTFKAISYALVAVTLRLLGEFDTSSMEHSFFQSFYAEPVQGINQKHSYPVCCKKRSLPVLVVSACSVPDLQEVQIQRRSNPVN